MLRLGKARSSDNALIRDAFTNACAPRCLITDTQPSPHRRSHHRSDAPPNPSDHFFLTCALIPASHHPPPYTPDEILIGLARGTAQLHRARVVHRDLTEPGKNALLRREPDGSITAAVIDLSQSELCPQGRGAAARSVDMYAFGNVLYFLCYGRVARAVPWNRFSCMGSPKGLAELLQLHEHEHAVGRAGQPNLLNRCTPQLRPQLLELMQYCWAPALFSARASGGERLNHSWDYVQERLLTMRDQGVALLNA